jgi:hypothetical protein
MATTPVVPTSPVISGVLHGPYEDAIIAGFKVMEKLIDGQTAEQKAQLWANWITFWQPFMEIAKSLSANLAGLIKGL